MSSVDRGRQPLDYWLDPQLGSANPESPTALRIMAANHGQRQGTLGVLWVLAAAGVLGGAVLLAAGATAGGSGVLVAGLALAALAGGLRARWARHPLRTKLPAVTRAPQTMAAAWALWGGAGALIAVLVLVAVLRQPGLEPTAGPVAGLAAAVIVPLAVLAAVLFIPAYRNEHAREEFRALLARRADLRTSLEQMAAEWADPRWPFGPL
ncbi:hypothetical protein [Sinomonas soli]